MGQSLSAVFYRGRQDRMDYKPTTGDVVNGQVVDVGNIIGICTSVEGIGNTILGSLAITGVFKLKVNTGNLTATYTQGQAIYYDIANGTAYGNSTFGAVRAGIADEAKISGDDHVKVNINVNAAQT